MNMINMHVLFTIVIIILLIALMFKIVWSDGYTTIRTLQFAFSLPGASLLLSIVHLLDISYNRKELLNHVVELAEKYRNPCRFILGTDIYVILAKPEDYKPILENPNGNYKDTVTRFWRILIGNGILSISGTTHRHRRKTIQRILNNKFISEHVTSFQDYSNYYADLLEEKIGGCTFDIKPYAARYTTDIILATLMGVRGTAHMGEYDELLKWQEKMLKIVYKRSITPWLYFDWVFACTEDAKKMRIGLKYVGDFFESILSQNATERHILHHGNRFAMPEESKSVFINQLFDQFTEKGFSREDYVDDIRSFYFAAQNTITEAICFVLLMLAIHTDVQEKLRNDILHTFGNNDIDATRISEMIYLRMVIKETLRLLPIVPMIARQVTKDTKIESYTLPRGTYVMIPIFVVHRNSTYWHDAEKFIPERFSPDSHMSKNQSHAYIPFGTGLRSCLGQKYAFQCVATAIVTLVRRFRLETTVKMEDINLTHDILLRCKNSVKLSVFRA